jgi:hypothetical protein
VDVVGRREEDAHDLLAVDLIAAEQLLGCESGQLAL